MNIVDLTVIQCLDNNNESKSRVHVWVIFNKYHIKLCVTITILNFINTIGISFEYLQLIR